MRQECINAVQKAASRRLTQQEIQNIEDRIYRNMRQLARNDPHHGVCLLTQRGCDALVNLQLMN